MSDKTKIQWCDSTINPTMGCEGCELWSAKVKKCYAGILHVRRGGNTKGFSPTFEELTFWPGRMAKAARWKDLSGEARGDKPWLDGLPRLIFVSDMSDALSGVVPFEYLRDEIVANVTMPEGRRHRWLWLTKRPDRMAQFSDFLRAEGIAWPENLWAGTSITTQRTTGRIKSLLKVGDEGTTRFLSMEPQYEPIDLSTWLPRLDWVIQGGESGHDAKPFHVEWALDLIRQCVAAGVPYFLKQLGSMAFVRGRRLKLADHHGGDWGEWPASIRVREMPIGLVPAEGTVHPMGRRCGEVEERIDDPARGKPGLPHDNLAEKRRQAALKAWATRRAKQVDEG